MTNFKCKQCEREFDIKTNCIVHHLETKHEDFEINGADVKINIKTP